MSFWNRLGDIICRIPGGCAVVDHVVEAIRSTFGTAAERRHAAFSIAMIALAAKMAKADGVVTSDEIVAFKELFEIPEAERHNVARLFNLAKQDVAGFEAYAKRMAGLFDEGSEIFEDIVDGLFHIAKADGALHEDELAFISRVASIFGISETAYLRIESRHVVPAEGDPYHILGIERSASNDDVKRHYRRIVSETHPDKLMARGVPAEFIAIATAKLAALNVAYDRIRRERAFA
jgi:DnaJ like chaperone protein